MKNKALVIGLTFLAASSAQAGLFANGGFESGNLSGWSQGGGSNYDTNVVKPAISTYNGGVSNNTVVGVGTDAITGASTVYSGNYAVRVNDDYNNRSLSTIYQSVNNYTDNNIFFAWNAVLEDSHFTYDSDYFSLQLVDNTTNTILVNRSYSSAGSIGAGTSGVTWSQFGSWFSSGWVVENIDLVALNAVGHDFTLALLAADCPYNGHAGYAYLDGFGAKPPVRSVPEPSSLLMLGLGLLGLVGIRKKVAAK
ncbi:hypothetical protein GCM10011613_26390 [Cellvibrio zantedeschiae]|uniref:Ice-binding protein C-terminal domain-containing protein n=1 Tax=Cellvibrio zantedeschiae TaxID=1237077 RepID=A0ABQ3B691_9GAMM|nr:PEP-CTERM sorting domain-containing protein [Cellvibrio zantedeschiae]GGY80088.1 hypothetical protein GCM10011613_26390 [Cellvibrio zantedeschiae]